MGYEVAFRENTSPESLFLSECELTAVMCPRNEVTPQVALQELKLIQVVDVFNARKLSVITYSKHEIKHFVLKIRS